MRQRCQTRQHKDVFTFPRVMVLCWSNNLRQPRDSWVNKWSLLLLILLIYIFFFECIRLTPNFIRTSLSPEIRTCVSHRHTEASCTRTQILKQKRTIPNSVPSYRTYTNTQILHKGLSPDPAIPGPTWCSNTFFFFFVLCPSSLYVTFTWMMDLVKAQNLLWFLLTPFTIQVFKDIFIPVN